MDTVEKSPPAVLPESLISFINVWKDRPGNLIMVLHKVQEHYQYIPRDVAMEVARMLGVPLARIWGVITFYHLFKLKKPGKNRIAVCLGTACYLKGAQDLIDELQNLLGIGVNSITPDGKFSIEAVRCLGCCGLAPVLTVNGETYGTLVKEKLPDILAKYND
jgi:NADH-quinone oxidoreductase subunit E